MTTFVNNDVQSGNIIYAADHNEQGARVAAVLNGNIDSANLADASVSTAKIVDASVTNAKLSTTAGELGGVWKSWTPTFSNLTKGSATINAKYIQIGKTVHFRLSVVLAADSSVGANPAFSLPVTAAAYGATAGEVQIGFCEALDAGTASYLGVITLTSTTTASYTKYTVSGANIAKSGYSATSPFTFGTGDEINATGTYEAA